VASRIGALVLKGDADGVAVWKAIARKIEAFTGPETARQ
jgi:hypothetical protein